VESQTRAQWRGVVASCAGHRQCLDASVRVFVMHTDREKRYQSYAQLDVLVCGRLIFHWALWLCFTVRQCPRIGKFGWKTTPCKQQFSTRLFHSFERIFRLFFLTLI